MKSPLSSAQQCPLSRKPGTKIKQAAIAIENAFQLTVHVAKQVYACCISTKLPGAITQQHATSNVTTKSDGNYTEASEGMISKEGMANAFSNTCN